MWRVLLAQLPHTELEAYLARVVLEKHTDKTVTDRDKLRRCIIKARQQGYAIADKRQAAGRYRHQHQRRPGRLRYPDAPVPATAAGEGPTDDLGSASGDCQP
ncbi:IclR family transcriptional regulator domain-containing protein [Modicisalibacter luteus]|uniref:IclR family transcriptional regulator C-terminal domain-containing protein n=1 Tax=Modicisalibacter luteus TaxID=453962 RepID=A0ABV7LXA6_9GAMM|nr:IclR family transcriptional regulator C-terminal domain-containing protein [Halomonas lutea]GHB12816.1 hypothetical protein GCM10007159_38880 [Halomonas lutea]